MAFNVGAIEGTLTLDRTPFQRGLAAAREEAKRFASERFTPTLGLADDVAKAKLDDLRLKLDRLDHKRVSVKVDVDRSSLQTIERFLGGAGGGLGKIPGIGGLLELPFKGVGLLVSGLQKLPGLLESVGQFATTAFQTIAGTINDLRTGATTAGQVLGSLVSGFISVIASGGATLLLVGALVVAFGLLAQAVISVVAALAALVASFAAAVAGAGALFIGAFAAAIPVVGVLIAFFSRLVAVIQAHKAAQQAATQAAQQHKQALQQQHAATLTLASAQANLKAQTTAAYSAMKQSVVDYQHALLSVEQTRLGIEGARLSLRQAKQDLKDFLKTTGGGNALGVLMKSFTNVDFNPEDARGVFGRTTGKNLSGDNLLKLQQLLFGVKSATLGVKTANQSYQDSLTGLQTAEQKRADFLQNGISAYAPYRNAVTQVTKAQNSLHTAMTRTSAAQVAYNQKLKGLSTTEQGFLGTLGQISKTFSDIAKQVAAPIFKGIEASFGSIQKLISDPTIQRGLTGIGTAIGSVIKQFARSLSTKPWKDAIGQFLTAGAQLTRQGGKLFSGFLTVLRDIAQTAIPYVIKGVKSLAGWFTDLGKRPGAIRKAVDFLVGQFKIWLGVAKALGGLIVAFLKDAAGAGGKLATHLASILRHWTDWLNKHPGAVKKFFDDAVTSTKKLLDNLGGIVSALKTISDIVNAPGKAGAAAGKAFFGAGQDNTAEGSVIDNALKAIDNKNASFASRVNAGLAVLQLDIGKDARDEIEHKLRALGYKGSFDAGSLKLPKPIRHGDPAPRTPFAQGSSVTIHNHITTTDPDPQHYASKLSTHQGRAAQRQARKNGSRR